MNPLRVLVVDDSAFNRRTITGLLESIPDVVVIGKASDGDEALRLALQLEPDLVTLDLEMPRMDGFTFLRLLMARRPTPILVISGNAEKGNVFRALELGALDFVAKPSRAANTDLAGIREELAEKVALVRHLAPARRVLRRALTPVPPPMSSRPPPRRQPSRVICIGASTGGPTALVRLIRRLPSDLDAAVLIAQHMPPRFTRTFAERLHRLGTLRVREASRSHLLAAGDAWICPGGSSMEIGADAMLVVVEDVDKDRYVPSIDRLFQTAASKFGARCVGVVLTGMGDDGARGAHAIRRAGGLVLAESPDSAVISGMPDSAQRAGGVDEFLDIPEIAARLRIVTAQPIAR